MTKQAQTNRVRIYVPMGELTWGSIISQLFGIKGIGALIDQGRVRSSVGSYIVQQHNEIVREVMGFRDWDYLLLLEHDHTFPEDILEVVRNLKTPGVYGPIYVSRKPPFEPILFEWNEDLTKVRQWDAVEAYEAAQKSEPIKGRWGFGMGCTAIHRSVFENWPADLPWFLQGTNPQGQILSDDMYFLRECHKQGVPVYIHPDFQCGHKTSVYANLTHSLAALHGAQAKAEAEKPKLEVVTRGA